MISKRSIRSNDDDYAAHLYCVIFDEPEDGDDYNPRRILDILKTLTEREQRVIECRYRYNETFDQISEKIGVTRERTRQILVKAIRKLRHPALKREMSISQIEQERDGYKQTVMEQEAVIHELSKQVAYLSNNSATCIEVPVAANRLGWSLEEMDISVRLHNALARAGYRSVCDIYEIPSFKELCQIKNLGAKSREELFEKMRDLGYPDWIEKIRNSQV